MTLEQLRIFMVVAQHEHVTRGAEVLGMTQSAASGAIAALEREFGTKLFHRVGRGIVLTEGGRLLAAEAGGVLARAESAALAMREFTGLARGRLAVMASQTIAGHLLPARLVAFHRAYPGVALAVSVGNSAQVIGAILQGRIELGFIEGPRDDVTEPNLATELIATDPLVMIVSPAHPWASRQGLNADDLATGQWVVREDGSGTRAVFFRALESLGVARERVDIVIELPSNEAIMAATVAGAGPTIVSALVCQSEIAAGTVVRVPVSLPPRAFFAVQHVDRYRSRAVAAFLGILRGWEAGREESSFFEKKEAKKLS
jgi:DNA-binding transcriptional LysR family regulator